MEMIGFWDSITGFGEGNPFPSLLPVPQGPRGEEGEAIDIASFVRRQRSATRTSNLSNRVAQGIEDPQGLPGLPSEGVTKIRKLNGAPRPTGP